MMHTVMGHRIQHITSSTVVSAFIFLCITGTVNAGKSSSEQESAEIEKLVQVVTTAINKGDFDALEKYVQSERGIIALPCYVDTSGDRPQPFNQIKQWLKADSTGAKLRVTVRYSKYYKSHWGLVEIPPESISEHYPDHFVVQAEGWAGEWSFINFSFSQYDDNWVWADKWTWRNVCYAGTPGPGVPYHEPPKLPRPGPRTFSDSFALYARIEEIVRFRAFDALRVYAVRGTIKEVPCDQSMFSRTPKGKEVPVSQVISFLKDQTVGGNEITLTTPGDLPLVLESRGWCCAYPIINFIVRPTPPDSKYEWAGVAYCHSRVPSGPIIIDLPVKSGDGK